MAPKTLKPDSLEAGNGTEALASSTGALNISEDVLQGFLNVREQHRDLAGVLHQIMRRTVLPRCKAIGDELARIRDLYPKGKKGPGGVASGFFRDAEQLTGLKKAQVLNYITISAGWYRLMDFMADLPEGAAPIQSMSGALEVLRAMGRPMRPALPGSEGAVDVDAVTVASTNTTAGERTRYVHTTREKVLPALAALKATPVGLKHEDRLETLLQALHSLLDAMEVEEEQAATWPESPEPEQKPEPAPIAAPEVKQPEPEPEPEPTPTPTPTPKPARRTMASIFPVTDEGLKTMRAHIAEHGSVEQAAKALGVKLAIYHGHFLKLVRC